MAITIKESFKEFASNVNITDRQETVVANCKNNVVAKIKAKLSLHPEEARVIGSWDRDTLVRYLSEGDVDVMIVLGRRCAPRLRVFRFNSLKDQLVEPRENVSYNFYYIRSQAAESLRSSD